MRESNGSRTHRRAAIVGVGLIGGSLGLALRRRGWRVVGIGRNLARLRRAKVRKCVDEYTNDLKTGSAGCSLVVLAVPVDRIIPFAQALKPHLEKNCLVMDVGSVKAPIVKVLDRTFNSSDGPYFVSTHPMAGSEKTGVANSRADLYRNAACILTPGPRAPSSAVSRAEKIWRSLGGRTVRLSPDEHDRSIALISHLPHLLADAMVLAVGNQGKAGRLAARLAAGSFRDMTRVAAADPAQWHSIFHMNAKELGRAAAVLQAALRRLIRTRFSLSDLKKAQKWRNTYLNN